MNESFQRWFHLLAPVGAYLIGGIPFGLLIGWLHGVDLRELGSHNIGATNAGRILGQGTGRLVFGLDALKGLVCSVTMGWLLYGSGNTWAQTHAASAELAWAAVGLAAVLGHIFCPYLGFRGGKGVATAFGALLGYWPWLTLTTLICLAVWFAVLKRTRFVSLASLSAAIVLLPIYAVILYLAVGQSLWQAGWLAVLSVVVCLLLFFAHRSNIARLLKGEEPQWLQSPPTRPTRLP